MDGPVRTRTGIAATVAWCALLPAAAGAGDLTIRVDGLRSGEGAVLVALCGAETFTTETCETRGEASAGSAVVLRGVAPGTYAVQAIHDENRDGALNRRFLLPTEGLAFSRDAPMRRGPPRFDDAAIEVGPEGGTVSMTMRYFQ